MEEEKKKRRTIVSLVIGIITFVLLIAGATFAYFVVGTTNNFGSTSINTIADGVGSVALSETSASLRLNLRAVDMMKMGKSVFYYSTII